MNIINSLLSIFKKKQVQTIVESPKLIEKVEEQKQQPVVQQIDDSKKQEIKRSIVADIIQTAKIDNKNIFKTALQLTLKYEGGYSNNPADPGGETNKGIIKTEYDLYRKEKNLLVQSVKNISDEEVEDIYYNKYWLKSQCDKLYDKLAILHFDTCVNTGIKQGSKFLQRSCNVKDDGVVGLDTLKAVFAIDKIKLIDSYISQRKEFYQNLVKSKPTLQQFLKGWLNRISNLEIYLKQN